MMSGGEIVSMKNVIFVFKKNSDNGKLPEAASKLFKPSFQHLMKHKILVHLMVLKTHKFVKDAGQKIT